MYKYTVIAAFPLYSSKRPNRAFAS